MKQLLIVLIGFLGQSILWAQDFGPDYQRYKTAYPEAYRVVINQETIITLDLNKDGEVEILNEEIEEVMHLSASASFSSEKSIQYSTFFQLESVEASTFLYQGGKYKEIKVKDFHEKDELSGASFHDDLKSLSFVYPNLSEGAKTLLNTRVRITNPRFLSAHLFGDFAPILHNKLTIICNKAIQIETKQFNFNQLNIVSKKEEKGANYIYTWEIKNVAKFESESSAPSYKTRLPHILPIITSYTPKGGKKVELLGNVSQLYKWYYSLISKVNQEESNQELVAIVDSLVANKDTELEKVKAIYYWAQSAIKYVAFEYALGGFVPREATDVFLKKYGDCKDNSSILTEMLKIAGIKGYLTWIGTRSIPYTYQEVPTPAVDNHMILTYIKEDSTVYFLDATGRYLSIESPSSFIQGKEALIAIDKSNYLIKKVPVVPPSQNAHLDSMFITIEEGNLLGTGKLEVSGYEKINLFNALERIDNDEDLKTFYNHQLRKGSNKFLVKKFEETNRYDYDKNFLVQYEFDIASYININNDELYVNLSLDKSFSEFKIKKDRVNDFEIHNQSFTKYVNVLTIPQGYSVSYIPENSQINTEFFDFVITYRQDKGKLYYEHEVVFKFLILEKEHFTAFNEAIKQLNKAYKETVVLKKKI